MTPRFQPNLLLTRRLAMYAVAGSAALATCPSAGAEPIRFNQTYDLSIPNVAPASLSQDLDLNGDGTSDFKMSVGYVLGDTLFAAQLTALNGAVASNGTYAWAFGDGYIVGPTGTDWQSMPVTLRKISDGTLSGTWPNDITQTRYAGVRFQSGGNLHYGWIAASAEVTETNSVLRVTGWGYERLANTEILVGDGELVPEPSSLALFALGAAGIAALMRRRRSRA